MGWNKKIPWRPTRTSTDTRAWLTLLGIIRGPEFHWKNRTGDEIRGLAENSFSNRSHGSGGSRARNIRWILVNEDPSELMHRRNSSAHSESRFELRRESSWARYTAKHQDSRSLNTRRNCRSCKRPGRRDARRDTGLGTPARRHRLHSNDASFIRGCRFLMKGSSLALGWSRCWSLPPRAGELEGQVNAAATMRSWLLGQTEK